MGNLAAAHPVDTNGVLGFANVVRLVAVSAVVIFSAINPVSASAADIHWRPLGFVIADGSDERDIAFEQAMATNAQREG